MPMWLLSRARARVREIRHAERLNGADVLLGDALDQAASAARRAAIVEMVAQAMVAADIVGDGTD